MGKEWEGRWVGVWTEKAYYARARVLSVGVGVMGLGYVRWGREEVDWVPFHEVRRVREYR